MPHTLLNSLFFLLIWLQIPPVSAQEPIPRTVIALYDSEIQSRIWLLNLHELAEMPLNQLGLKLHYHDLRKGLPDIKNQKEILGVLTWFPYFAVSSNPIEYIDWAVSVIESGKKFVIVGNPNFHAKNTITPIYVINRFWEKLGLKDTNLFVQNTFKSKFVYLDPLMTSFERPYQGIIPGYNIIEAISNDVKSHVIISQNNDNNAKAALITTGPNGGYAVENFTLYRMADPAFDHRQWYINPFQFFRLAFDSDKVPKPDATTIAGRRIYYNQIDGDGWNNISEIEKYRKLSLLCPDVLYREIFSPYRDLPVTVGPIAADVDLKWVGTPASREIATKIFELPHVEMGCHTFTHPFDWEFFQNYTPEKELPYLDKYPQGGWKQEGWVGFLWKTVTGQKSHGMNAEEMSSDDESFNWPVGTLSPGFAIPRAFALQPFNLNLEIFGAIKEINGLAPPNKRVEIYQWSGNCDPFAKAIEMTREAGVRNINGGNSRFDKQYPSYGWVRPLGLEVEDQKQIYASNSNEMSYTDSWTSDLYAFNELPETFRNTETPIRVKPMDLYYHMYSGAKLPSLQALFQNLEYIRKREICPVSASEFSAIADGFYSSVITPLSQKSWKIENRGHLQTIRFDRSTLAAVNFSQSKGIVGQRHFQGSLYVYLDAAEEIPVLTLQDTDIFYEEPAADVPYLIHSRWTVWNVARVSDEKFSVKSQGFGTGKMRWKVPHDGMYRITIPSLSFDVQSLNHILDFSFPTDASAIDPIEITLEKKGTNP